MATRTIARRVAAEPQLDSRDLDPAYCELVDFCEHYAGRSRRLRAKAACWLLVRYHRRPIAEVAWLARRHEATIRGHVRDVDRGLYSFAGRETIEALLGLRHAA
jgi:hypothetical protein